jgi:hypothetical protein
MAGITPIAAQWISPLTIKVLPLEQACEEPGGVTENS